MSVLPNARPMLSAEKLAEPGGEIAFELQHVNAPKAVPDLIEILLWWEQTGQFRSWGQN
jgi:hypothetical protein